MSDERLWIMAEEQCQISSSQPSRRSRRYTCSLSRSVRELKGFNGPSLLFVLQHKWLVAASALTAQYATVVPFRCGSQLQPFTSLQL